MATLYANKVRKNDNNFGVHDSSDHHNLRVDYKNSHSRKGDFDPDLSHKNIYYIFDPDKDSAVKVDRPTEQHILKIREWQKQTAKALKPKHTRKNTLDRNDDIQNTKKALRNWIGSDKTTEEERELYQEVLKKIESNLKNGDPANFENDVLEQFSLIAEQAKSEGVKISRYNDKRKRLQKIISIDFEREDKRGVNNSTRQTEYLFKIPDQNHLKWSNKQMLKIARDFKEYFKDYDILYLAIHHDENPDNPHLHFALSNLNRKTNKYDIVQAEINAVRQWQVENNIEPDPILDIAKTDMNEEQISKFGELFQDFMFDIANRQKPTPAYKESKKIKVAEPDFRKRTEEEKRKANHTYEQNKPIAQRQHNRQRKVIEQVKKEVKQYKKIKKTVEAYEQKKIDLSNDFKKAKKTLDQSYIEIQELQDRTQSFFEVIASIISSLKDLFTGRNTEHAQSNLYHQYDKLLYEHDWTQEQVRQMKKVKPSEPESAYEVGQSVIDNQMESAKDKLERAKKMLDEVKISKRPSNKDKPS